MLANLRAAVPPGWRVAPCGRLDRLYSVVVGGPGPRAAVRRFHLLYADARLVARTLDSDEVVRLFGSDLERYIAEEAVGRIFVHAGVVGWGRRAIIMPARSFSGKTTLVAALVRAGATYYSDEYAVFDRQGRVHPFPRPLSMRDTQGHALAPVRPEALGGCTGHGPLAVGLVAVTRYRPGAAWRPRALSAGEAVLALMANAVAVRRQPRATLAVLRRAAIGARTVGGVRGPAEDMAGVLLREMTPAHDRWRP
jgi:hypothetical protein